MKTASFSTTAVVLIVALASLPVFAQSTRIVASSITVPELRGQLIRERMDPCLGLHWQWLADPEHPEWPTRLVIVGSHPSGLSPQPVNSFPRYPAAGLSQRPALIPVIHAGDLITVHHETGVVRARLQAVALDSALPGHSLRARLTVTSDRRLGMNSLLTSQGPIVTATATGVDQAVWGGVPGGYVVRQEQSQ